ncbi:hydroxyproline O-arabinosyltransferase 3 isoform X2 [Selaginella moellendorffii]|nr:hydroxyproline O-arabinosyltransferase 3 isoform X2 [Selaginella moellendorffii]|eukprot:XP_002988029.2 hydroxyproline O-arabinosyltransferase 3 isoform X2 [Selaginella moellendorffii]
MGRISFFFLVLLFVAFTAAIYNTARFIAASDSTLGGGEEEFDFNPGGKKKLFHTVVTSSSGSYARWQCRIMYYWFKKFKDQPGSEMGGFTRILHSGAPDDLMDEIPTFVADPLPSGLDKGYIVLHRPWAFVQWLRNATIEEDYIFMAEPDHLITKPLPNLASRLRPAAFPFFYITPEKYEREVGKFFKGPVQAVDPVGNSPAIIHKAQLLRIAPTWHNLSIQMKQDPETDKAFGWVLEMYAYAIASAVHGVKHTLRKDFMIQPPWDTSLGDKYIIHYTYGCDYTLEGVLTYGKVGEWRFDKRSFTAGAPPRNLTLPPANVPGSVAMLVKMINQATADIPNWKAGE